MKKLMIASVFACTVINPAWAGGDGGGNAHKGGGMLKQMDTNNDMQVTYDEFMTFAESKFRESDVNGDGVINQDDRGKRGK